MVICALCSISFVKSKTSTKVSRWELTARSPFQKKCWKSASLPPSPFFHPKAPFVTLSTPSVSLSPPSAPALAFRFCSKVVVHETRFWLHLGGWCVYRHQQRVLFCWQSQWTVRVHVSPISGYQNPLREKSGLGSMRSSLIAKNRDVLELPKS